MSIWGKNIIARVAHDYMTGADGETFAIGRGLGIVLFVSGLIFPIGVGIYSAIMLKPALSEWAGYLAALAAYWAGLAAAASALIWATNSTEPKSTIKETTTVAASGPDGSATTVTETTGKPAPELER